jgi:hypothetical protein
MTSSTPLGTGGKRDLTAYYKSIEEPFRKTMASLREADIYDNLFDVLGLITLSVLYHSYLISSTASFLAI